MQLKSACTKGDVCNGIGWGVYESFAHQANLPTYHIVYSTTQRTTQYTGLSFLQDKEPLENPYADPELTLPLPNDLHHWLYERTK